MTTKSRETKKAVTIRGKRSPNYPTINLEKAVSMISSLYDKFQRHPVPAPLAMEAMGYSIKSGRAQSMLASISYYDLIQMERGSLETKKVNISPLGFTILKNPDAKARDEAIKEAAIRPAIFKKLIAKFPTELPNDSLLAWELENNFDFNARSIPDFIEILKQTLNFAKTYEIGIMEEEDQILERQKTEEKEGKDMQESSSLYKKPLTEKPVIPPGQEREVANYPIGRGLKARIVVSGDTPVKLDAIEKLIKLLEINKEDLTEEDGGEDPSEN